MFQEPHWMGRVTRRLAVPLLGFGALLATVLPAFPHAVPLTDRQKIGAAEQIVLATVESRNVRWNSQRSLIVTAYTLRVEERLKGSGTDRLELVVPGGSLDGETHETCLSVSLEPGERYVLFVNDLERPSLTPLTGASQGVYRELRTKDGRRLVAQGALPYVPLKMHGRPVDLATFVASLRDLIAEQAKRGSFLEEADGVLAGIEDKDLPAQEFIPLGAAGPGTLPVHETELPLAAPEVELPPLPALDAYLAVPSTETTGDLLSLPMRAPDARHGKYNVQGAPAPPIVFNPLPSRSSWSPLDQNQMAYWNRYAQNLFRVRASTGNWSFGNGVFDIAGFPNNTTMIQQFGQGWGRDVLGVTWSRSLLGRIIEADVALNPAFSWTKDTAVARQATGRSHSFQQTMLHELGHAWGLKHPWETQDVWWDSVMNYAPKEFRVPVLWTDDSTAAYRFYPGITIRDGAISLWSTRDQFFSNNPTYLPFQVNPPSGPIGTTFTVVNPIKIENTGTVPLVNPVIEIWASPRRYSFSGAFLIKTIRLQQTIPTFNTLRVTVGTFRIPSTARPGTYYVAAVLRDSADNYQANNVAW